MSVLSKRSKAFIEELVPIIKKGKIISVYEICVEYKIRNKQPLKPFDYKLYHKISALLKKAYTTGNLRSIESARVKDVNGTSPIGFKRVYYTKGNQPDPELVVKE